MLHRLGRLAGTGAAALVGLVVAIVVTLNLHIVVGLEQGYAATPAEVFDRSILLGVLDLLLLLVGPAAAVLLLRRSSRRG